MAPKRKRADSSAPRAQSSRGKQLETFEIEFRDDEQRDKFALLSKRKIVNTKYLDKHCLRTLGLWDDVAFLIDNIGWNRFMLGKWETYPGITLEFLSSLHIEHFVGDHYAYGEFTFRLFNKERRLSVTDVNRIFGFPIMEGGLRPPQEYDATKFWTKITKEPNLHVRYAKSTSIKNPIFRYMHRVLTYTLFGRGDSNGAVRSTELYYLWAMISGYVPNTGGCLLGQFDRGANSPTGLIVIGGLITPIALYFKNDLRGLPQAHGTKTVGIDTFFSMRLVEYHEGQYRLILSGGATFPLPNPTFTSIKYEQNWLMHIPSDQLARIPNNEAPRSLQRVKSEDIEASPVETHQDDPPLPPQPQRDSDTLGLIQATVASLAESHKSLIQLVEAQSQQQQLHTNRIEALHGRLDVYEERLAKLEQQVDLVDKRIQGVRQAEGVTHLGMDAMRKHIVTLQAIAMRAHDCHVSQGHFSSTRPSTDHLDSPSLTQHPSSVEPVTAPHTIIVSSSAAETASTDAPAATLDQPVTSPPPPDSSVAAPQQN